MGIVGVYEKGGGGYCWGCMKREGVGTVGGV